MPRIAQPHPTDPVAQRLFFTRLALGYTDQGKYARNAGMTPQTYNAFERGSRSLSLWAANRLIATYGLTREWLFDGIPNRLPHELVMKLIAYGAPGADSRPSPPSPKK